MRFRRLVGGLVAAAVASVGLVGLAGPAAAIDHEDDEHGPPGVELPSASAAVVCATVTLTYSNPTQWDFSFDYRVDQQPAVDTDEWGDTYVLTEVDGRDDGHQQTVVVGFGEDTGSHTVDFRVARGDRPDLFDPDAWQSVQVDTNCQPDPTPAAVVAAEADCAATPPGYAVHLNNPTAADVVFTVDQIVNGQTMPTGVVVPAGQAVDQSIPTAEDVPTRLRVRGGDVVLADEMVTVDCAAESMADPAEPAEPSGSDPPRLADGNHLADDSTAPTPRPLRSDDDKIKLVSTTKLAYIAPAGDVPLLTGVGGTLLLIGTAMLATDRKRRARRS